MEQEYIYSTLFKRIFALVIDFIPLGIITFLLIAIFKDFFIEHQNIGTISLWILTQTYFTIWNSELKNGQTIGKQFMQIQVTDLNGKTLNLKKSFFRSFLITIPIFINDIHFVKNTDSFLFEIVIKVIGIFLSIDYFYFLLNFKTRESLHDYATQTIVLKEYRDPEQVIQSFIPKKAILISGALLAITSLFFFYIWIENINKNEILISANDKLSEIDELNHFNLTKTIYSSKKNESIEEYNLEISISDKYKIDSNIRNIKPFFSIFKILAEDTIINRNDSTIVNIEINQGYSFGTYSETKKITYNTNIRDIKEFVNKK